MIYLSKYDYKLLGEWKLYDYNQFLDQKYKRQYMLEPSLLPNAAVSEENNSQLINVPTFDKKQNVFTFSIDILKALKH